MEAFDVAVIGGGPGGYPAAIRAAQLGARVALVERQSLGGTCLNTGCIPMKTLIASSSFYAGIRRARAFGIQAEGVSFDYGAMVKRKDEAVATLRRGLTQLIEANGIQVFNGTGSFDSRSVIRVTAPGTGEQTCFRAAATIIATGSEPAVPDSVPKGPGVYDSTGFLAANRLPRSLLILGGGSIGCEFACMAAQLGVDVTVVELLHDILPPLDRDVRSVLRRQMASDLGVHILTGHRLEKIEAGKDGVTGVAGKQKLRAEALLVSAGRRPVTAGLWLEKAGLKTNPDGSLPVDACCRTERSGIYAVGDVTEGSTQLAHAATAQGTAAAESICLKRRPPAEQLVPACIYTWPEIGIVGPTEQEARASGRAVRTGKFPFAALARAVAAGETGGFVKWIADAETAQLLGAQAVGPHATELISEAATAIRSELTIDDVQATVHPHPTFSEAWLEAAHAFHGSCIHAAPRRRR